ncbi:RICIN domain-containing protein [Streptomyces blastmyceticus]|uniref:Ricin B lectin domain-containing protein n=1 Tax=Streptomyces blastmyceticus TaxID=68180 RepID=A0ABP3H816_9ACTN
MSRTIRAALATGLGIAALVGGTTTAYADQSTDTSSFVRLRAEHSGKCLTIENARIGNGAYAVQQSCADDLDNQIFELAPTGSASFEVRAKHSGRCMRYNGGQGVQQFWCNGDSNERWRVVLVEVAKGLYELRPMSAPENCLTIDPDASDNDGAHAITLYCIQHPIQRWRVQPVTS